MSGWKTVCESAPSLAHKNQNEPCEDAAVVGQYDEHVIMIVADGAGSSEYIDSDSASSIAAYAAKFHAKELLTPEQICSPEWKAALTTVIERTQVDVEAAARRRNIPTLQFATTLIVVAATSDTVVTGQVGDGAVVVADRNGQFSTVHSPAPSMYANRTEFLLPTARIGYRRIVTPVRTLVAMSDGLEAAAFKGKEPFAEFFRPLCRWSQDLSAEDCHQRVSDFLNSEAVMLLGDDLSLCLATRED